MGGYILQKRAPQFLISNLGGPRLQQAVGRA
jgi:hypothetical protein